MKKIVYAGKTAIVFVSLFFGALLAGCDQEPLFWDIAHEYPPIEPTIAGHPSKIVELNGTLYVANTVGVFQYDTNAQLPVWTPIAAPYSTHYVAVAGGALFALDRSGIIYKLENAAWKIIHQGALVQKIFGVGNRLFASAQTGSLNIDYGYTVAYTILCLDAANGAVLSSIPNTGLLMGAEELAGTIYLGTLGGGLYSGSAAGTDFSSNDRVTYGDSIVGLTVYNSNLFIVTYIDIFCLGKGRIATGSSFTGAIAGWTDNSKTNHLLLLGIQNSSGQFGYGYREIQIDDSGSPISYGFQVPGASGVSSVTQAAQYTSAIGEHSINYLYVCNDMVRRADADNRPIVFACTFKDGLWSYRTRYGVIQWNGENITGF